MLGDVRGNKRNNNDSNDSDEDAYNNMILWFGCKPRDGVDASSTIAVDFFKQMKRAASTNSDGRVVLPNDLRRWREMA